MQGKKILLLSLAVIIALASIFAYQLTERKTLKLSDFPEVFKENTVIVIGDNASEIEKQAAEQIAEHLKQITKNKPEIISSKDFERFKNSYNLIVVGTPKSNPVLEEVYAMTNAIRVNESFPGENKGILEILRNPWNEEKALLLVEGSDEWGVKAGGEMLRETCIGKSDVVVKWEGSKASFSPLIPPDKYVFIGVEKIVEGAPILVDRPRNLVYINPSEGVISHPKYKPQINDSLVAIISQTTKIKKPGGGAGSSVKFIYNLPFQELKYIDSDGTVYLNIHGKQIVLPPLKEKTIKYTEKFAGYNARIQLSIKNWGLQNKLDIKYE